MTLREPLQRFLSVAQHHGWPGNVRLQTHRRAGRLSKKDPVRVRTRIKSFPASSHKTGTRPRFPELRFYIRGNSLSVLSSNVASDGPARATRCPRFPDGCRAVAGPQVPSTRLFQGCSQRARSSPLLHPSLFRPIFCSVDWLSNQGFVVDRSLPRL